MRKGYEKIYLGHQSRRAYDMIDAAPSDNTVEGSNTRVTGS